MSCEVIVVGSVMMDFVSYAPRLPLKGETIIGHKFAMGFGGKGANQAVMVANLGVSILFCCKMGEDMYADNYSASLVKSNVSLCCSRSSNDSTGIATITVDDDGNNSIVIMAGANLAFTEEDVQQCINHFSGAKILICQNEISKIATQTALFLARSHSVLSIYNPAPVSEDAKELSLLADIVCLNEVELVTLVDFFTIVKPIDVTSNDDVVRGIQILKDFGCKTIVVTLGERGACIADDSIAFVSAPKVHCIDSVGAGDCFIGSMGAHMARGANLKSAVQCALICASNSVTKEGSQKSYPRIGDSGIPAIGSRQ